jgi:membrane protease subunit (stomatin/prohibitin family)
MVNLKYFTDLKWGTMDPVAFRDSELGLIRLRAHGVYSLQIVQPVLFINALVGTMGSFATDDIAAYLKKVIVSRFNDYLGERLDTIFNLPGQFEAFSVDLQQRLVEDFAHFGLRLSHLYITSITPPEVVQQAIDDQGRMNAIKDMDRFVRMKAGMAMEKAAAGQGEAAAGIGMGMGLMMPAMFARNLATSIPAQAEAAVKSICPDCRNAIPEDARFCPICGHQQVILSQCRHCGKNLSPKARFCSQCGRPTDQATAALPCPECKGENLPDALFCNHCGRRL